VKDTKLRRMWQPRDVVEGHISDFGHCRTASRATGGRGIFHRPLGRCLSAKNEALTPMVATRLIARPDVAGTGLYIYYKPAHPWSNANRP